MARDADAIVPMDTFRRSMLSAMTKPAAATVRIDNKIPIDHRPRLPITPAAESQKTNRYLQY
jgi:hypothetical protein